MRERLTLVDGAVSTVEIVNAGRWQRSSTLVDLRERSASVDGALSTAGTVNADEETVNHVALRELKVD